MSIIDSIRNALKHESVPAGNYKSKDPRSSASGAYSIIDSTWNGYRGYRHASDAPADVQDSFATREIERLYNRFGDARYVLAAWFVGEGKAAALGPNSDYVPPSNSISIRQYVARMSRFLRTDTTEQKTISLGSGAAKVKTEPDRDLTPIKPTPGNPQLRKTFILGVGFVLIIVAFVSWK